MALLMTGGGYHDYKKLVPHLTTNRSQLANVSFEVRVDLDALKDLKFAEKYDVVVHDLCFDETDGPDSTTPDFFPGNHCNGKQKAIARIQNYSAYKDNAVFEFFTEWV